MGCRILLTAFRNTSAQWLLSSECGYDRLLLPNDKHRDGELLTGQLLEAQYDFVLSVGQRPNIKDKIHIETTAKQDDIVLQTKVDCEKLAHLFDINGIPAKLSHNAGTSFCNALYFKGLQFVQEHVQNTGVVFIHIPFQKNISSPDIFQKCFFDAVDLLSRKGVDDLWIK